MNSNSKEDDIERAEEFEYRCNSKIFYPYYK